MSLKLIYNGGNGFAAETPDVRKTWRVRGRRLFTKRHVRSRESKCSRIGASQSGRSRRVFLRRESPASRRTRRRAVGTTTIDQFETWHGHDKHCQIRQRVFDHGL